MEQLFFIAHVLIALTIIGLVLIQQGKGADIGAAFGGGASGTFFGSAGATSFLIKFTAGLAICFFMTSLTLGHIASSKSTNQGVQTLSEEISQVKKQPEVEISAPAASDIPNIDEKPVEEN